MNNRCMRCRRVLVLLLLVPAQQSGRIKIKQIYRIQVFAFRKKKRSGCLVLLGEVMVCDGESKKEEKNQIKGQEGELKAERDGVKTTTDEEIRGTSE